MNGGGTKNIKWLSVISKNISDTYYIYIIYIRMISVLYSSKDWSFNQNLAYLWSFFEHISICFD